MATPQQILTFKRFNLAGRCFDRARALAQHMIDTKPDPTKLLYSPMIAGVVVTYMRPFVRSDGLGPLPQMFTQFQDNTLQETHIQMLESRHKLYAHQDVLSASSLATDDGRIAFDMTIEFDGSNRYSLMPGNIEVSPNTLPAIVSLCEFQRNRITKEIKDSWPALTASKTYTKGKYKLGVNFP
jgi:hypothetical protein